MSIMICVADGSQTPESLAGVREMWREKTGLPISDTPLLQFSMFREGDLTPMDEAFRTRLQRAINTSARYGRDHPESLLHIDYEYPGFTTLEMNELQLTTRSAFMAIFQAQGLKVGNWGMPMVNERSQTWTTQRSLNCYQQINESADFILVSLALYNTEPETFEDLNRIVDVARHAVETLSIHDKPVLVSTQTFVRVDGGRRVLKPQTAYAMGVALRAVHNAGGFPVFWTERLGTDNTRYEHQENALDEIGEYMLAGWKSVDLFVEANAGDPLPQVTQ